MKKVSIITAYFYPENTAATNRMVSMAKVLSNKYKVNVVSLTEKGNQRISKCLNFDKRINVFYINQKKYNVRNFFIRAFYEFFYSFKLAILSREIKSDATIVTSPYMFLIPMVIIFAGKTRKFLDLRDLVWVYLDESSLFRKIVKLFLTFISKKFIERYRYVTVTNNTERKWVLDNTSQRNVAVVSNGISQEHFNDLSNIKASNCGDKLVISYIGNVGIAQNLLVLVKIAQELNSIMVNIIGDGNDIRNLRSYAAINNVTNVNFRSKLSFAELRKYYENSHILYAQLDEKFYSAFPSKLFEYLSTGLPIVYGGKGEVADFARRFENFYLIFPNDEEELKNIIKKLATKRLRISLKNRKLISENFIREKINLKYLDILKKI